MSRVVRITAQGKVKAAPRQELASRPELTDLNTMSRVAHGEPLRVTHGEPAWDVTESLASGVSALTVTPLRTACSAVRW